jgi:D-alanine--poly(phosphoribitol) ligase subunit 1
MNSTIILLDRAAEKYGDKIGYEDEWESISFSQLREKAMVIGTRLLKDIKPGRTVSPVIVYIPKSVKCIVSYMGILYSGNPYVPVDDNMPLIRLQKIINNLKPGAIITDKEHIGNLDTIDLGGAKAYLYDDISEGEVDISLIETKIQGVIDTDPIYVMYTSGSTGEPKGGVIPHRGVIDYAKWVVETFSFNEDTVMASQAPFYFDNSVFEIYSCLVCGGRLVLIPEVLMKFSLKLPEFLEEHKINTIFWVPTVLINIANSGVLSKHELPHLKIVAFCGEVMPNKQLNIWRKEHPHCLYANLYGPMEITDVCSYYIVDRPFEDSDPLPIGRACKNTRIIILNEEDRIAEVGEPGEICVIGSGVGLGYWGNVEATDRAFVQNPVNPYFNETIYRTGDLAYVNEEGLIMFLGRMDSQIKLRGNRIELGEVEKAAACIDNVGRACAIFHAEQEEIVLFLETPEEFVLRKINMELLKYIPRYMLPHRLVTMEEFPRTANDKIDRITLRKEYLEEK